MRGKAAEKNIERRRNRITPAYAGKRWGGGEERNQKKDHPRLCGEKTIPLTTTRFALGSPPPMRGKVVSAFTTLVTVRITPAYAGKSQCFHTEYTTPKDHPRLCGEKSLILCTSYNRKGSPPPMRGKVFADASKHAFDGITPAYAGKSVRGDPRCHLSGDHPRLCGEKCGRGTCS